MHHLPYAAKGPFAKVDIPHPEWKNLRSVINFEQPPSNIPIPTSPEGWLNDRTKLGIHMFRAEATVDFLLRGLTECDSLSEGWTFPRTGQASKAEIDEISE